MDGLMLEKMLIKDYIPTQIAIIIDLKPLVKNRNRDLGQRKREKYFSNAWRRLEV
jgi:hypothetical protein